MIEQLQLAEWKRRDLAILCFERALDDLVETDGDMVVDATLEEDGHFRKGIVPLNDVMQISMPFSADVGEPQVRTVVGLAL